MRHFSLRKLFSTQTVLKVVGMHDMLVRLYDGDYRRDEVSEQRSGLIIRKPIGPEHDLVREWIAESFNRGWASEAGVALGNRPPSLFVALVHERLAGFACYDATALGYFGPTGVAEQYRRKGIGKALLFAALADMRSRGYGYAIIGGVGPAKYYEKTVGAIDIPGSSPGIWQSWLR